MTETSYSTLLYVQDHSTGSVPAFEDDDLKQRATARGGTGNPEGAFLSLQVTPDSANCREKGFYKCRITYISANETNYVTSTSVFIDIVVPPSSAPPSFILSLSNIPGALPTSHTYLKGTTILLGCRAEVGSPAYPMRFCLKTPTGYELITKLEENSLSPSSTNPAKTCMMSRTIIASLLVNTEGEIHCDVYNATSNMGCHLHPRTASETFSVQDFPVCNTSTKSLLNLSTTKASLSNQSVGVTSVPVQAIPLVTTESAMGGLAVLVLGCVLIALSGAFLVTSVIICRKAKTLRKEAELVLIRSTYDSINFKTSPASEYSSLDNLTTTSSHPLERQDSDGYMIPTSLK
ncbi:uncharacterized protein LOC125652858 isoform X2 [Ostrea edulis]|nr:uncharacterized protein LOC125652858 isoform X2 [Ostrea edulis]XP_048738258.2 uncharacterized protein LOC125652858 isoform X2 [Ostrea edulis]